MECDHLSFCPSILTILKFLDSSDLFNCKLVNSRINAVIQNNKARLPKPIIFIGFNCPAKDHTFIHGEFNLFLITYHHITIWKPRNPRVKTINSLYLSPLGFPVSKNELTEEETKPVNFINKKYKWADGENAKCYRIPSMEEGLRLLLRILFGLFHFGWAFSSSHPEKEFQRNWITIVRDEIKMSRTVFYEVATDVIWPCMLDLIRTSGCATLKLYMNTTSFSDLLPSLTFEKMDNQLMRCKIDSYSSIIDLIKNIQTSSCPIP